MDRQEYIHQKHLPYQNQRHEVEKRAEAFLRPHHILHYLIPTVSDHAYKDTQSRVPNVVKVEPWLQFLPSSIKIFVIFDLDLVRIQLNPQHPVHHNEYEHQHKKTIQLFSRFLPLSVEHIKRLIQPKDFHKLKNPTPFYEWDQILKRVETPRFVFICRVGIVEGLARFQDE